MGSRRGVIDVSNPVSFPTPPVDNGVVSDKPDGVGNVLPPPVDIGVAREEPVKGEGFLPQVEVRGVRMTALLVSRRCGGGTEVDGRKVV